LPIETIRRLVKGQNLTLVKRFARIFADVCERVALKLKFYKFGNSFIGRAFVDTVYYPADLYKIITQYRSTFGRLPRLIRPTTFNEWIQRSKLVRRGMRYQCFADKLLVRDFVKEKIGEDVLTRVFWTGVDLSRAKDLPLPRKFVIKSNNGSGKNLIVRDASLFDWEEAIPIANAWLASDHSTYFAEWQYRWIQPRLFVEEFLEDQDGNIPTDYKFFCFDGRVQIVQVDLDRFNKHTRALLNRKFELLPFHFQYPGPLEKISRPENFDYMIKIAEALSAGECFIRVDLYDVGRPIFGELTLYPEAGLGKFEPPEWDERLFRLLNVHGNNRPPEAIS